jgi:hypothetical protein
MYVPSDARKSAPTGNLEYGLYMPFLTEKMHMNRVVEEGCCDKELTAFGQ